jgi:hypothetical protein
VRWPVISLLIVSASLVVSLFLFQAHGPGGEAGDDDAEQAEQARSVLRLSERIAATDATREAPDAALSAPQTTVTDAPSSEEIIHQLHEFAAYDDPEHLELILVELTNPDSEIRRAAREAVAQFGSRAAIPRLKELAALTDDIAERIEILQTAGFLDLPVWKENGEQLPMRRGAINRARSAHTANP